MPMRVITACDLVFNVVVNATIPVWDASSKPYRKAAAASVAYPCSQKSGCSRQTISTAARRDLRTDPMPPDHPDEGGPPS